MFRTCKQCGGKFEWRYGPGRPRERCFTCQPVGMRVASVAAGVRPRRVGWRSSPAPEVLAAVERSVAELGADGSVPAVLAVVAARHFAEGGHTLREFVALSKAIRVALAQLPALEFSRTAAASPGGDELQRLRRLRAERETSRRAFPPEIGDN